MHVLTPPPAPSAHRRGHRYPLTLAAVFAAVWVWAAINPAYRFDWFLENLLVFAFVPILVATYWKFRLSNISYTLIAVFLILHVIGSHYTYSEVPFGETISRWFGAERNHYDRIVHFSFGLFLGYPIRELFLRVANAKGFWGYYLPLDVTLSFSALYEIIEWLTAATVNPAAGISFVGTQGDAWDAQKDMAIAGVGAVVSMVVTAFINWWYDPAFGREIAESFRVKRREPLGEVKLRELMGEGNHEL